MLKKINFLNLPTLTLVIAVIASVALYGCKDRQYDMAESDLIVNKILSDSVFTQKEYSHMIEVLNDGYEYLRQRIANVAFDNDPNAAVQDFLNLINDSTLRQVQRNSRIIIKELSSSQLDEKNGIAFRKIYQKYHQLDLSLKTDSTDLSAH